jgi:ERCC4-type nuclease
MKKLLGILVLGLLVITTPSHASDIRDFQIGGIAIEDHLLDHFSDVKISIYKKIISRDKKFISVLIPRTDIKGGSEYDDIQITYSADGAKNNLKEIHSLKGIVYIHNNDYANCNKQKEGIAKELSKLFGNEKNRNINAIHKLDESGNSKYSSINFELQNGTASIVCYDWSSKFSQEKGLMDSLVVSLDRASVSDKTEMLANKKHDSGSNPIPFEDETIVIKGNYYALVVGNNDYKRLQKLDNAVNDAKVISEVLAADYGFEVKLVLNATRKETLNVLYELKNKLKTNDKLLIYYSGHGELDTDENKGYWLPIDANRNSQTEWISTTRIVDAVKAIKAKHVLLMVDSCFSGSVVRGFNIEKDSSISEGKALAQLSADEKKSIEKLLMKKSRLVITSGGLEPVLDTGENGHSGFAYKFLSILNDNSGIISTNFIFNNIRNYVLVNADQTPEISTLHKAGHDGGDFFFVKKLVDTKQETLKAAVPIDIQSTSETSLFFSEDNYHALIIGNNDYKHYNKLNTPVNDAKSLAKVLSEKYDFNVHLMINADYETTINNLFSITKKLTKDDKLLIYYDGHSLSIQEMGRSYWIPIDGDKESRSKWISSSAIVDAIKSTKAKHVLLMSNECFIDGPLLRGDIKTTSKNLNERYINKMLIRKSRLFICGGFEHAIDESGDLSIFMKKFINILNENKYVVDSLHVFTTLKEYLIDDNLFRTPVMNVIRNTGHDGGVFLFMAKNK